MADESVISIGRSSDNTISLSSDSNISRYHAEIEKRGDEFWLIELGSSNGTTLNGYTVTSERLLRDGDIIVLGGSSEIRFELQKETVSETLPAATGVSSTTPETSVEINQEAAAEAIAADTETASKMPLMLGIMGALCGLAVICVVAVILVSWTGSGCEATAFISNPDNGETISEETDVQATVTNSQCVGRVIFMLDGREFASANSEPYKVSLNPGQFEETDDNSHILKIVLEDTEGNKLIQPNEVLLAFETLATPTPTPEETPDAKPTPKTSQSKQQLSATEVPEAAKQLISQFPSKSAYKFDSQFLQEVQKKTAEYAVEGFFTKANVNYKDTINVAYRNENVDLRMGYLLAMSRSKFNPQKQGTEEGLWRMSNEFATANSLNGLCGTETIGDPLQNCAAKVSALYMKYLLLNIFEGDVIYSVAAFGMSPQEAATWKNSLPADRKDFWNVIKSSKQREEVVRFFAAGIVAENPQKFGLKKDRPLSEVYRNLVGN